MAFNVQTAGDEAIYVKFPGASGRPTPASGRAIALPEGTKEVRCIWKGTSKTDANVIWVHKWRLALSGSNCSFSMSSNDAKFEQSGTTGRCKDGKTITVTVNPNTNYKFDGWNDGNTSNPRTFTMKSHVSFSASASLIVHTVRFIDYNGTVLKTESVVHGSGATAPSNPSRDGYTFTGWDKAYNIIVADTDVYAQYSILQYTVTFYNNRNKNAVLQTYTVNHGDTVSHTMPAIDGWTPGSWNTLSGNSYGQPITQNSEYSAMYSRVCTMSDSTGSGGTASTDENLLMNIEHEVAQQRFDIMLRHAYGQIQHEASPNHKAVLAIYTSTSVGMNFYTDYFLYACVLSHANETMSFDITHEGGTSDWDSYDPSSDMLVPTRTLRWTPNTTRVGGILSKQGGCSVSWNITMTVEFWLL